MNQISKMFLKGLAVVLPISVTIYMLYWVGHSAETLMSKLMSHVLPEGYDLPGLGVVVGFLLIFVIGALTKTYLAGHMIRFSEQILARIPVVKTVYGALKDVMDLFSGGDGKRQMGQVVLVPWGGPGARVMGFLTRESIDDLGAHTDESDTVAVYLPMSYQIGGYTIFVKRADIEPLQISVEDALRFAVTAGMGSVGTSDTES